MGDGTRRRSILLWIAVWLLTRLMMLNDTGVGTRLGVLNWEDVDIYRRWAGQMNRTGQLPTDAQWQYPPGAGFLFHVPSWFGNYHAGFVTLIFLADAAITVLLARMALRYATTHGVWMWLLGIPLLGGIVLLRFDTIPTLVACAGLALSANPTALGAMAGLGAGIKVWPAALLVAPGDDRSSRRAMLSAAVAGGVIWLAATIVFGNPMSFLSNQSGRGLELESIAATPWVLRQALDIEPLHWVVGSGALQIRGDIAERVAQALMLWLFVVAAACAVWTVTRIRLVRAGRSELADHSLGVDAAFTALLLFTVVHEVLSPQYMVWLVGIGAVALCATNCRVRRPIFAVCIAVAITRATWNGFGMLVGRQSTDFAWLLVLRNVALVYAAVDASITLVKVLGVAQRGVRDAAVLAELDESIGEPDLITT